jgi:hypothetical protein
MEEKIMVKYLWKKVRLWKSRRWFGTTEEAPT